MQFLLKLNDFLALILEFSSLYVLLRWINSSPRKAAITIVLVVLTVLGFAMIWALFFSPKAKYPFKTPLSWVLQFIVMFFPFMQFVKDRKEITIVAFVLIFINLFIQAKYGRAEWGFMK